MCKSYEIVLCALYHDNKVILQYPKVRLCKKGMHFFLQLTDDKGFPIKNFSVTEPKQEEAKKPA